MEKTSIVKKEHEFYEIDEQKIFLWKHKETKYENGKAIITFERDALSFESELDNLQKEFNKSSKIPFWLMLCLSIIIFVLFTTFIILLLINKEQFSVKNLFFPVLLPGIILTLAVGILGVVRTRQQQKYVDTTEARYAKYRELVEALIEKNK